LTYARARYYQPEIGRFISEDTYKGDLWNPQSQNGYSYVHNNPMLYVDPSGHIAWNQWDDLALGVYDTLKGTVEEFLSWETYVGLYQFGQAIYNGKIGLQDLVSALGSSAKDKINYFSKNTIPIFTGNPTDKEVRRYGQEMGEILTMVGGSTAALKLIIKAAPKLAKKLDVKGLLDCNCFTAGTKVLTDEGEKPIEEIEVGDKVLAKSDETGEVAYKEVEWLYQRDVEETYNITVGGEVITTTDEHPFWIVGKGWVEAQHLKVDDVLTTSDGKELAIEKIEVKKEHKTVYNFKVKDFW
ncbi:polymorphic toxin-type HINT domain-containing protein, partial [Paenibacillus sp. PL2-23]